MSWVKGRETLAFLRGGPPLPCANRTQTLAAAVDTTRGSPVNLTSLSLKPRREREALGSRSVRSLRGRNSVLLVIAAAAAVLALSVRDGGVDGTASVAPVVPPPSAAPTPFEPAPTVPEEPAERAVPLSVRIASIRVDAPLVPVGIEADGAMEIPKDVQEIGWYDPYGELGVVPGTAGTAVLAGHVDSRSQGRGALYELRELRTGAEVEVTMSDGSVQRWTITEVIQYPKDVLPYEELFVWSGPPRLAIITCGGEFDRTARSYRDNIVVYAAPIESFRT